MTDLPNALPPSDPPKAPGWRPPQGAWDAHVHLVAGDDFPLWDGRVENPAPGPDFDGWLDIFLRHLETLGLSKGLIVHSILYGADNAVTLEAVRRLGNGFKGVGLVTDAATDAELDALVAAHVVAVRLNYVHGGVLSWEGARAMAPRLADRGLHIQMLAHSHLHLAELERDVRALPVPVVFDHIAWPDLSLGVTDPGFQTLLRIVGDGAAFVKLSGIYRLCPAPYDQAAPFVEALARANPDRCLWGSDWPHLMLADAAQPDAGVLLDALTDVVTDEATRARILVETPEGLFGG